MKNILEGIGVLILLPIFLGLTIGAIFIAPILSLFFGIIIVFFVGYLCVMPEDTKTKK